LSLYKKEGVEEKDQKIEGDEQRGMRFLCFEDAHFCPLPRALSLLSSFWSECTAHSPACEWFGRQWFQLSSVFKGHVNKASSCSLNLRTPNMR
jgi:hypothetical protein